MANPFNNPGSYDNISTLNFDILIEAKQSPNTFHPNPAYPSYFFIENPEWNGDEYILNTTPLFIKEGEVYTPYSPPENTYLLNSEWQGGYQFIEKPDDYTGDELYIENPAWNGQPQYIEGPYLPPKIYIFDGNDYVPFAYIAYIINPLWNGEPQYILWDNSEPALLPDTVILPTEVEIPILYPFMDKVQDYTDILERYGLAINNYVITYEKDNIVKIISSNAEPNFSITIKGMSFNLSDLYNAINKRDLKIQINKIRFALEEEDDIAYLNTLTMYGIGLTSKIQKDTLNAGSFVKPNNYNKNVVDVDVNMVIDYNNILTYIYNPAMIKNISIGGGTNTMRMSFFCSILK